LSVIGARGGGARAPLPRRVGCGAGTHFASNDAGLADVVHFTSEPLSASVAGVYQIDAGAQWQANTEGKRFLAVQLGGVCCDAASWTNATIGAPTIQNVSDLVMNYDAGVTLSLEDTHATFLAMHWVSP
jgi:hypothetical protein